MPDRSPPRRFASIPASLAALHPLSPVPLAAYALETSAGRDDVLLFGHANGFAAGSYAPLLLRLTRHMTVYAYDMRGHGGSALPAGTPDEVMHLDQLAADLAEVLELVRSECGRARIWLAAHSVSAVAAMRLLARGSRNVAGLIAYDAPVPLPPDTPEGRLAREMNAARLESTARRRARWPSPEAYAAALERAPDFSSWTPDALLAHARATLCPESDGTFRLCCAPEVEAAVYRANMDPGTFPLLSRIAVPTLLVSADPGHPRAGWACRGQDRIRAAIPGAHLLTFAGSTHLLPLDRVEDVAAATLRFALPGERADAG